MPVLLSTQCLVCASDWRHPDWVGGFYPEDMPVEWWLTYYNTQFSAVWLPRAAWLSAPLDEVRQWLADTHAEFRFLLEAVPAEDPRARSRLDLLAPKLDMVCATDDPRLLWFEAKTELAGLADSVRSRAAAGQAPVLVSRDGDLDGIERVRTLISLLGL